MYIFMIHLNNGLVEFEHQMEFSINMTENVLSEEWFVIIAWFLIWNLLCLDVSCRVFVSQLPFDVTKDGNNRDFYSLDVKIYKSYKVEISSRYVWG